MDKGAALGRYYEKKDDEPRLLHWLTTKIFEEKEMLKNDVHSKYSHVYQWRSFSNPANSSKNNAFELGDRTWNLPNTLFSKRRALVEEAQEVKSSAIANDSGVQKTVKGQDALQIIRKNSDLYRQIPSRYILVGHSMGGVVAREYVQGNFYNNDVDKVITLDSLHEGTGALNMQIYKESRGWTDEKLEDILVQSVGSMMSVGLFLSVIGVDAVSVDAGMCLILYSSAILGSASIPLTRLFSPETYERSDPLVYYLDPSKKGFNTIDSLNKLEIDAEKLPMFRLLGSEKSMTFSDPLSIDYGLIGNLFLENFSLPFINFKRQMNGSGDISTRYVNALSAGFAGIVGIPLLDNGSSLVSEESGLGNNLSLFNDEKIDVKKRAFNAAVNASGKGGEITSALIIAGSSLLAFEATLGIAFPAAAKAAKASVALAFALDYAPSLYFALKSGFEDLADSHQMPLYAKNQKKWFAKDSNSFNLIEKSGGEYYKPYLMEDFLYERPFMNLAFDDLKTLDSLKKNPNAILNKSCFYTDSKENIDCSVGLYGKSDSILKKIALSGNLSPIKFHSENDWSKIGVKVDRWERIPGLTPSGDTASKIVPIRHVERYEMPAVTVTDYIQKYSFVVDDLMPHRLRQIKMNFNYQEQIAWECDITKEPDANNACAVYKRKSGEDWKLATDVGNKGYVSHPVKKNGPFDFEPKKYGYSNLLALQKDNQNTIAISTVNKIGLGNTQRFYYQFKATDNLLEPVWPKAGVVLNKLEGFEAYASVLDYQGFAVECIRDSLSRCKDNSCFDVSAISKELNNMTFSRNENSGKIFGSTQNVENPEEGTYLWTFNVISLDSISQNRDSSDIYNVLFNVDTTPPTFNLKAEATMLNPDSLNFIARFAWDSLERNSPDIRAMELSLEKYQNGDFVKIGKLPSLYDVASKDFAIDWEGIDVANLNDGRYRLKAYAFDNAVPNKNAYDKVNNLINKIAKGADTFDDWDSIKVLGLNETEQYADFFVDRTTPVLNFDNVGFVLEDSLQSGFGLTGPAKNFGVIYVAKNQLLNLKYSVKESLEGSDSALVKVNFSFIRESDSTKSIAGDSLWVSDENILAYGHWTEMGSLKLGDGDYILQGIAKDLAKNAFTKKSPQKIRIDRTAPEIYSLVSSQLIYGDSIEQISAAIRVTERFDTDSNRTGMHCYYRIQGGTSEEWFPISDKILHADTLTFDIKRSLVGTAQGKRYLEAACVDAAGNVGKKTDLFYVGKRYPQITSPEESMIDAQLVAIKGIAPPANFGKSENAIYRLRYRMADDSTWRTDGIFAEAMNRSDTAANVSRISQSSEGLLGYLDRIVASDTLNETVIIELGTRSCDSCRWLTDSVEVLLKMLPEKINEPALVFESEKKSMTIGEDSLQLNLHVDGLEQDETSLRIYGKDSKGVGLFEVSADNIRGNPYKGIPADTTKEKGVWFYKQDSLYHLIWKGFESGMEISIQLDPATFGETCLSIDGRTMDKYCKVESAPITNIIPTLDYFKDYPYWKPLEKSTHVMRLSGTSGHLVVNSSYAFRVNPILDTSFANSMPVYFGDNKNPGFKSNFGIEAERINPFNVGWTIDPKIFGLSYKWDGLVSGTKFYPAAGNVTLYAVAENRNNGDISILLDSINVFLTAPPLKIALSNVLEDYIGLNGLLKDSTLSKKQIQFGVLYRDALVNVFIEDENGKRYSLQENLTLKANTNPYAYSVLWDGRLNGVAAKSGTYKIIVEAEESGTENPQIVSAEARFNVSFAPSLVLVNDGTGAPNLRVSEAFVDKENNNRYVPVADYLVQAKLKGKYLPDSVIKNLTLSATLNGTQQAIGYDAKRFSLAIKRQREQLDLVVVTHVHVRTDEITGGSLTWCSEDNTKTHEEYNSFEINFSGNSREKAIYWAKSYKDRGFDGKDGPKDGYVDLFVMTIPDYQDFLRGKDYLEIKSQNAFDSAKTLAVWKLEDFIKQDNVFRIPGKSMESFVLGDSIPGSQNCQSLSRLGELDSICEYGKNSTDRYNPNRNLLTVKFSPKGENGMYYDNKGAINTHCTDDDHKRYKELKFNISLTILDSYWNAPYGYDNLVNRTIRFDATNKTIYSSENGYLKALDDAKLYGDSNYFDGTRWVKNHTYGKLTPFEMQLLRFYPANILPGGVNTFLFADEDAQHIQPSYFNLKFYGQQDSNDYFEAAVLGTPISDAKDCEYSQKNLDVAFGNPPRCQISITSLQDSVKTPLFAGGYVDFFVGRNTKWNVLQKDSVEYPASKNWVKALKSDSIKYYAVGSKVHYYFGDFSDSLWQRAYTTEDGFIRNHVNSPAKAYSPENFASINLDTNRIGGNEVLSKIKLVNYLDSNSYRNGKFFIHLDTLEKIKNCMPEIEPKIYSKISGIDSSYVSFSEDTLNLKGFEWNNNLVYRRSLDSLSQIPTPTRYEELSLNDLYKFQSGIMVAKLPWVKEVVVDSAQLTHLDSSEHSHFNIVKFADSSNLVIGFRENESVARPAEFIEIRSNLNAGENYTLSYLKDSVFHWVLDTMVTTSGEYRLTWFNANRLQGNTTFLLTWGGSEKVFYDRYDLYVGELSSAGKTLKSLFGELSVTFPQKNEIRDVTVRTANASDYPFETFENVPLTGHVMEVLPSMEFNVGEYPRIQMKISRQEMESMGVTPATLRLFKVDFKNKKFVPLENILYGYLKADGSAAVAYSSKDNAKCERFDDASCFSSDWAYMLVSGETRTFSVFAALDSTEAIRFNDTKPIDSLPTQFKCIALGDSLWLGLDNGFLKYNVSCNQPASKTLTLFTGTTPVKEISWKDGDSLIYNGMDKIGKIPAGIYDSRFLGINLKGRSVQLSGPKIYTDERRPILDSFYVTESSQNLNKVFEISARIFDFESGVSQVQVEAFFGNAPLATYQLHPDSLGFIKLQIPLHRKDIALCMGCQLNLNIRAEDKGHNYTEKTYHSDKIYPFPESLVFWYPAHEGSGNIIHEVLGIGHDLNLSSVNNSWGSDAGLYLSHYDDKASGIFNVDLGTANGYTFETRIKRGYSDNRWCRILGFKGTSGLKMELLNQGRSLCLVEDNHQWCSNSILPNEKIWVHVATTIDSSEVRFYVDGELAFARDVSQSGLSHVERELYGKFSLGRGDSLSFIGNASDIRMYNKALNSEQIHALSVPVSESAEEAKIVAISLDDIEYSGFDKHFSCSVAGNRILESVTDDAIITAKLEIEYPGEYNINLYARSANVGLADIQIAEASSTLTGKVNLSPIWRSVKATGTKLHLSAGSHKLSLKFPEGVQLGGIAVTSGDVSGSSIPFGKNILHQSEETRKIKTFVTYANYSDLSMIRPRLRLINESNETVRGFSLRYYFRGENPSQVKTAAFFPAANSALSVHSETERLGYAEWKFDDINILPHKTPFYGEGPHFALFNKDYTLWDVSDDPSFVMDGAQGFAEDQGIIVLDSDENLIGGSCAEMEDSLKTVIRVRVLAADARLDNLASEIQLKLENLGNVSLENLKIRYFFYSEKKPILDIYFLPHGTSADLISLGNGRWSVDLKLIENINSNRSWSNAVKFALHLENWENDWNVFDDPSHRNLTSIMFAAENICVYDSLDNKIYGNEPVWNETEYDIAENRIDSIAKPIDSTITIPIVKTNEGFVVSLEKSAFVELSLVSAIGNPVANIFNGHLDSGLNAVTYDWNSQNTVGLYLVLKLDGKFFALKLLSEIPEGK